MRLSLLSNGYMSDSIDDAGPITTTHAPSCGAPQHFLALCRGVAVIVVLSVTLGLTVFEAGSHIDPSLDADASVDAPAR